MRVDFDGCLSTYYAYLDDSNFWFYVDVLEKEKQRVDSQDALIWFFGTSVSLGFSAAGSLAKLTTAQKLTKYGAKALFKGARFSTGSYSDDLNNVIYYLKDSYYREPNHYLKIHFYESTISINMCSGSNGMEYYHIYLWSGLNRYIDFAKQCGISIMTVNPKCFRGC